MAKDGMDSTAVGRAPEPQPEREGFANRKLIRPSLNRELLRSEQQQGLERRDRPERAERSERPERIERSNGARKVAPPEQTHAENFYYQKQMQSKTPMVVVLQDGEELHGMIEWYDRNCIKLTRSGHSNLLIYKPAIKYMFKESER